MTLRLKSSSEVILVSLDPSHRDEFVCKNGVRKGVRMPEISRKEATENAQRTPDTRPAPAAMVWHEPAAAWRAAPPSILRVARRVLVCAFKLLRAAFHFCCSSWNNWLLPMKINTHTYIFWSFIVIGWCSETLVKARDTLRIRETGFDYER